MFCTSLRSRADLKGLVTKLVSWKTPLQETKLNTHDLAFPIPSSLLTSASPCVLHVLIFSPPSLHETTLAQTKSRLNRFVSLTGGNYIAVAFLLSPSSVEEGQQEESLAFGAMHAYTALQVLIHLYPSNSTIIPVLPIPTPSHLEPLLAHHITLLSSYPPSSFHPSPYHLLSHLTVTAPAKPLSEHATYVLGDICGSIKNVSIVAREDNGDEKDGNVLESYLGQKEGRGIRDFWEDEWVFE